MNKENIILKYEFQIAENLRKMSTANIGEYGVLEYTNKIYQQFIDDLKAMNKALPPDVLPKLNLIEEAAANYADIKGGGEYGLVKNSFKQGIVWFLDQININLTKN
jgi:flagellar biosynthesis regulator FlaF